MQTYFNHLPTPLIYKNIQINITYSTNFCITRACTNPPPDSASLTFDSLCVHCSSDDWTLTMSADFSPPISEPS